MDLRFWRKKRLLATVVIAVVLAAFLLFLLTLKLDFDQEEDAVTQYFAQQPGMPDAFTMLEQLSPSDAVVLCWWDYGRSVMKWSQREVIEAYPSREIAKTMGSTRSLWGNLEAQMFAKWGSNEKIQDIARALMSDEAQSLQILSKYHATSVLVFVPDELQKFYWIAQIAGYTASQYLTQNEITGAYEPTVRGGEVTLLRLIFDDVWQPTHFTKLYDSGKAKIYQINY